MSQVGGEIFFNNQKITHTLMEKRPFNIVFQDYALFPNLTAYQNLTYGLRNKKECSTKAEVDELIQLLNLEKHLEKTNSSIVRRTKAAGCTWPDISDEAAAAFVG